MCSPPASAPTGARKPAGSSRNVWLGRSSRCIGRCCGAMGRGAQVNPDVWLVTGGLGYIGGHTVARLHAQGHRVVVLDDMSTGLTQRLPEGVPLVNASVLDESA